MCREALGNEAIGEGRYDRKVNRENNVLLAITDQQALEASKLSLADR